jgi:hypothetical protein
MSKFVSELMHSSVNAPRCTDRYLWLLMLLALAAYAAPWVVNPGVSFSPNAYDLAEWASIHPTSRIGSPPLFTSLLLRLPLVLLGLLVAFGEYRRSIPRWLAIGYLLLIAVALLPPLEFFTSASTDTNYQQQAILSFVTLLGGAIAISGFVPRANVQLVFAFTLVGAIICIAGLAQGYMLMRQFDLPVKIGMGGVAITGVFLVIALLQIHRIRYSGT